MVSLFLVLGAAAACSDSGTGDDGGGIILPDGSTCNKQNCGGCCKGAACIIAQSNQACGSNGETCKSCGTNEICAQGSCNKTSGACAPRNCPNGCCKGDKCQAGITRDACGKGGNACVTCASTQKCQNGACVCDSTSCSGCCHQSSCMPGTEAKFCGKNGQTCVACKAGEGCVNGVCTAGASCSPSSCPVGCCAGAACKTGDMVANCGSGGQPCKVCKTGEKCTGGVCNNPSVCGPGSCNGCCESGKCLSGTSTTACGKGGAVCSKCGTKQSCQSGACKMDLNSKWGITVVNATVDTGKKWDLLFNTEPDPYVEITVGSVQGQTTVKNNTYFPYWNELVLTTTARAITTYGMTVKVYDDDLAGKEAMADCTLGVSESALLSGAGQSTKCALSGTLYVTKIVFKFTSN
jgi:hypothetical protein